MKEAGWSSRGNSALPSLQLSWKVISRNYTYCKKPCRPPESRHMESNGVLWLNNIYKPGWVDGELASWDLGPRGATGYEKEVVSAETVSNLCAGGQLSEAVDALDMLVHTGYCASRCLIYSLLKKCVAHKDLLSGRRVHHISVKVGYESNTFLGNHILRMYALHGRLQEAMDVFSRVGKPDAFMWSSIISAYAKHGDAKQAIRLYHEMRRSSVKPDGHLFVAALQACASVADIESGRQVHADLLESGVELNLFVYNCLVDMYAKCGRLEDARRIFDSLATKDMVSCNAMVAGYAKCGRLEAAGSIFDSLVTKNVVTWTAMIAGYAQLGMGEEALSFYHRMQQEGITAPNAVTFACLLQACASLADVHQGRQLHAQIEQGRLRGDVVLDNSLLNMYAKCGSMLEAQQVFDSLPKRDIVAWTALVAGYTRHGESEVVFGLVERMREDGVQLNDITLLSLLTACSHAGLVNKGRAYFNAMHRDYGITPTVDHYACMVDLLGRAGQVEEALAVAKTMPFRPTASVWHTLLSACQKWKNVDVGRQVFDEAVKLDKKDAPAYVLMSNIYATAQMWVQAHEMQERRKLCGAWKQPGQSWWTDMDGVVHSFVVGDSLEAS